MSRYEHRWFNGRSWTSDVSNDGARFVDPLGLEPSANATSAEHGGRNGIATAAMVLGIMGVSTAWLPVIVAVGIVCGVLALIFGFVGLRRSRQSGVGRSIAIVGLATGASALAVAVLGVIFTMIVLDAYDEYLNPAPHEVEVTQCELQGARANMTGRLTNTGDTPADYTVTIGFVRPGTDNVKGTDQVKVDNVAAGATSEFVAQSQIDLDEIDCVVIEVTGPLPFGIAVD